MLSSSSRKDIIRQVIFQVYTRRSIFTDQAALVAVGGGFTTFLFTDSYGLTVRVAACWLS